MLAVNCSSGSVRQLTHMASLALHYRSSTPRWWVRNWRSLPSEGIGHAGIPRIREAEKFSMQRRAGHTVLYWTPPRGATVAKYHYYHSAKRTFSQISAHYGKHVFFYINRPNIPFIFSTICVYLLLILQLR